MSQPSGIALNNSHLLRAALGFAVIGVIGPGLFQLQPPQWFGAPDMSMAARDMPIMAGPEIAGTDITEKDAGPQIATVASATQSALSAAEQPVPAAASPAAPSNSAPSNSAPSNSAPSSSAPSNSAPARVAEAPKPEDVTVGEKARPDAVIALETGVATERAATPARIAKGTAGAAGTPPPQPEKPAVVARKAKEFAASATTQVASVAPPVAVPPLSAKPNAGPVIVAREFAKRIPEAHVSLPVKSQKESFVAMTLPLILAANEEISQRRSAIKRVVATGNRASVERWAKLYQVKTEGKSLAEIEKQLLLRADFVPVSLALAQAAIESGWGTSRFALQGNALFGQWAWQKDAGLKPAQASNANAVVRSFPNLFGSVRAYMHNLNTHPRYAAFRARRHLLRGRSEADLGYQLSNFMDGYAEIGEVYVGKLKTLIRSNDFGRYEKARLS